MDDLQFRRSTRCSTTACVEVATTDAAFVRDSKDNKSPILRFDAQHWMNFVRWQSGVEALSGGSTS
jgi:Domain of unknown function (DUF397)